MTQVRTAHCACAALTATCEGEPARISICHCGQCKRRTGSAFSWNATFDAAQVTASGPFNSYTRIADSGRSATFNFCPSCGVTVFYEIEVRPGMTTVPAGGFADADFPEPKVSVYDELACPWVRLETRGEIARE